MRDILGRYTRWLHTRWPAGVVEKLPQVDPDGSSNIQDLYIVGDCIARIDAGRTHVIALHA